MSFQSMFQDSRLWLVISLGSLFLCSYLPLKIKSDRQRKLIYRILLVPISLILLFYAYPVGIELFKGFALRS